MPELMTDSVNNSLCNFFFQWGLASLLAVYNWNWAFGDSTTLKMPIIQVDFLMIYIVVYVLSEMVQFSISINTQVVDFDGYHGFRFWGTFFSLS